MKVIYRQPDIYEQFELAREQARSEGLRIESFEITLDEFAEFIDMAADIDSKSLFAGYSVRTNPDGTKDYFYKDIPIIVEKK